MDKRLLEILCCPVTKLPLQLLDTEKLAQLNRAISAGQLRNHGDQSPPENFLEALVTRDGRRVYPVREGIPVLLEEESIDWQALG